MKTKLLKKIHKKYSTKVINGEIYLIDNKNKTARKYTCISHFMGNFVYEYLSPKEISNVIDKEIKRREIKEGRQNYKFIKEYKDAGI